MWGWIVFPKKDKKYIHKVRFKIVMKQMLVSVINCGVQFKRG